MKKEQGAKEYNSTKGKLYFPEYLLAMYFNEYRKELESQEKFSVQADGHDSFLSMTYINLNKQKKKGFQEFVNFFCKKIEEAYGMLFKKDHFKTIVEYETFIE